MQSSVTRKQLFGGDVSGRHVPIRPPGSAPESQFDSLCNNCGECIARCPTHILVLRRGNLPAVDFSLGECLFCGECAQACPTDAISQHARLAWSFKASIDETLCISFRGVECRSCQDPCESRAIRMPPQKGGMSVPKLDASECTGCGACVRVCPVSAISVHASEGAR